MPPYTEAYQAELLEHYVRSVEADLNQRRDENWMKNNPPTMRNLADAEWCVQAREKVVGLDPESNGSGNCRQWAQRMKDFIQGYFDENGIDNIHVERKYNHSYDHWWIEIYQEGFMMERPNPKIVTHPKKESMGTKCNF